jgi:hypothetical protein
MTPDLLPLNLRFLDHSSPALGEGVPGGLVGGFQRCVDVAGGCEEQGHIGEVVADGQGFEVGGRTGVGSVGGHTEGLPGGRAGRCAPQGSVQAVGVVAAWGNAGR